MINLYCVIGLLYSFYIYRRALPEEVVIRHIGDMTLLAVQAIGVALLWPLVMYVNHAWDEPEEGPKG